MKMLKKTLTRYAFVTTIIIAVMTTWMLSEYLHEPKVIEPAVVKVEPVVAPEPVKIEPKVEEPVVEEEVIVEDVKVTAVTFNRYPDDVPTIDELDVIGYQYGLPGKVLLGMGMKETHLDNTRVSHRNAKGMFQIRPRTANFLGVENIMDNFESADAAARYLAYLHDLLFDKPLSEHSEYTLKIVLGAYNAGPNNLRKVNGGYLLPNFRETRAYVQDIMGFVNGTKYYVQRGDTIGEIAEMYDIHPEVLMSVNGVSYTTLKYGTFIDVTENLYLVTNGDTLYSIARRLNTTLGELVAKNDIKDPSLIEVGQLLIF